MPDDSPITENLLSWSGGDPAGLEEVMALVYADLREMSRRALRGEREAHTLNPTALVHEVYMRLAKLKRVSWENRKPFFAFAARLMRRVLVEHARAANAIKREGFGRRVDLELDDLPNGRQTLDALLLDDVLTRLEAQDPFLVRLIELRFFSGLTEDEAAAVLAVPRTTVQREWRVGKLLLAEMLGGTQG
ncbi:MAG: ECF-type sigma factor [Acidobacteriota bacterium]